MSFSISEKIPPCIYVLLETLFTFCLGSFSWLGILSVKTLDIENEIMNTVRIILFFTSKDKIISLIWLYFKDRLHLISINLEEFLNLTLPSHQLPPNFTALVDLPYGKKRLPKKKKNAKLKNANEWPKNWWKAELKNANQLIVFGNAELKIHRFFVKCKNKNCEVLFKSWKNLHLMMLILACTNYIS